MKRLICIVVLLSLLCSLAACGGTDAEQGKLTIVTTIFPVYDWVRTLTEGMNINLVLLLDNGVDLHNYQPNAEDLLEIANCDAFVYIGGESDSWVDDALKTKANGSRVVLNLMQALGNAVKEETVPEGAEHSHEGEDEHENDEHIWLSLKNADLLCQSVAKMLRTLAPDSADKITANEAAYSAALRDLDGRFAEVVAAAPQHTVIFADRFPFLYLAEDYALDYYAAFSGCSAETEASFETVVFLAERLKESGASALLTIEGSTAKIADTVIETAKCPDTRVFSLNSMQSVTAADVKNGASYLNLMEQNLAALTQALQ